MFLVYFFLSHPVIQSTSTNTCWHYGDLEHMSTFNFNRVYQHDYPKWFSLIAIWILIVRFHYKQNSIIYGSIFISHHACVLWVLITLSYYPSLICHVFSFQKHGLVLIFHKNVNNKCKIWNMYYVLLCKKDLSVIRTHWFFSMGTSVFDAVITLEFFICSVTTNQTACLMPPRLTACASK